MFAGLMTRPVTVKRPLYGETDRYGNDAPNYGDETSWYEALCWVHPVSDTEQQDDKQRRVSEYRFFMQTDAELAADYRLELDGLDFEIVGEPSLFHTPRGGHHYEFTGRAVQG